MNAQNRPRRRSEEAAVSSSDRARHVSEPGCEVSDGSRRAMGSVVAQPTGVFRAVRSVDSELAPMIEFAIRRVPFGGARSSDLLIALGISSRRLSQTVHAGSSPLPVDDQETRWLKRSLLDTTSMSQGDDLAAADAVSC
ncbi:hypothetical protein [Nocardia xishanensis]